MARLLTAGAEWNETAAGARMEGVGVNGGSANATIITTTARTGTRAWSCATAAVAKSVILIGTISAIATGTTGFQRGYFRVPSGTGFPNADTFIAALEGSGESALPPGVKLRTTGVLALYDHGGVQVGADSAAINLDQWYQLEVKRDAIASGTGTLEAKLDGVTLATVATANLATGAVSSPEWGILNAAATNFTILWDDVCVNDSTGANQNTYPGAGSVVNLFPVSDNARTGWTGGALGTTNLWDAVNNTPPVGVAAASETNTSQIRDIAVNATDNYDANMTDYSTAGVPAGATITLLQAIAATGTEINTTENIGLKLVSNPAANEDTIAGGSAGVGTYSSAWVRAAGTVQYAPSVTLGTQPVLRLGKRTSTANAIDCCGMGIVVEFVPAVTAFIAAAPMILPTQAVKRSAYYHHREDDNDSGRTLRGRSRSKQHTRAGVLGRASRKSLSFLDAARGTRR